MLFPILIPLVHSFSSFFNSYINSIKKSFSSWLGWELSSTPYSMCVRISVTQYAFITEKVKIEKKLEKKVGIKRRRRKVKVKKKLEIEEEVERWGWKRRARGNEGAIGKEIIHIVILLVAFEYIMRRWWKVLGLTEKGKTWSQKTYIQYNIFILIFNKLATLFLCGRDNVTPK